MHREQRQRLISTGLLGLTLLTAAALRFYRLGTYGLWRDEAEAVFTASAGFPDGIVEVLRGDVHAPLYFYLLCLWIKVFGQSELAARSFSALLGVAGIPPIYLAGRMLFSRRAALMATWIATILPLHVACSRTARMYSLLPLCAGLTLLALLDALKHRRRAAWIAYAFCATATLYSHYWGALWVSALALIAIWQLAWERRSKDEWLACLVAHASVALLFLPWLPTLSRQLRIQESVIGPWLKQPSAVADILRLFNELTALAWPAGRPYLWMALLALGVVSVRLRREGDALLALEFSYPLDLGHVTITIGLFLPMLSGALVLARAHGLTPSYVTMAVFPALCLMLALGVNALRYRPLMLAALAGLSLLWLQADVGIYRGPISTLREVARHVQAAAGPDDVIIVAPDYLAPTFSFYFRGPQAQAAFPWLLRRVETMDWVGWAERRERAAEAIPATLDFIARQRGSAGKVWLVAPLDAYPGDPFFEQVRALETELGAKYRLLERVQNYRGAVESAEILVYGGDE